jgi:5S rRNA maturation endonuclease (ribonuclease M5)
MKTYSDYGIDIPPHKVAGEVTALCPECSHTRKKKKDKCLSVNLNKRVWACHHCGWKGGLPNEYQQMQKIEYKKPQAINKTGVGENVVKWFSDRGINQETLNHFKIVDKLEWMPQVNKEVNTILFPYYRDNELINIKYRDGAKNFKLAKEAELIFFNLDGVKDFDECYIVEGEMDCLSLWQSGVVNVLSVPNGANLKNNTLLYLDNSLDAISHIKRFHIVTDNDMAGRQLREDLSLRLGKENCDYIVFGEHKDANDCLKIEGYEGIQKYIANKIEFPLEGVFSVDDYSDEIDDFYYNGLPIGAKIGVPEVDDLVSFHKGYICGVTGIPSHGKALALDTPIPTINGMKTMKDIKDGDIVFDENGRTCNVIKAHDILYNRKCYEIVFDDGTKVIADANHLWLTSTVKSRRSARNKVNNDKKGSVSKKGNNQSHKRTFSSVKTTQEIKDTIYHQAKTEKRINHAISFCKEVKYETKKQLIPAYVLGCWLGDGTSESGSITCDDMEIIQNINNLGYITTKRKANFSYGILGIISSLRHYELIKNKHIPQDYMYGNVEQRIELLKGLMDTDGGFGNGVCEFCTIKIDLAKQVYQLVSSLGIKATLLTGDAKINGRFISKKYRIMFTPHFNVFKLSRKAAKCPIRKRNSHRFIREVNDIESVPVKCLTVDSPNRLYLCSDSYIPTHNTSLLDDFLVRLSITEKWKTAYYSPENKPTKLHFSKIARLYTGKFWDGEARMSYNELQLVKQFTRDKTWFIKPEKDFTLDSILTSVKQLILQRGIDCFVIDAWNKLEHKEETTGYVGKQLDKLADFCETNNVMCFLVAHPTKMKKTQDGMRYEIPTLYDIAGSANFYNKIDLGFCVYRNFETNVTTLIVQKVKFNHWGKTGSVNLNYSMPSGRYSVEGTTEYNLSWIKESQNHGIVAKILTTPPLEYDFKNEPKKEVIQSTINLDNPFEDKNYEPPF